MIVRAAVDEVQVEDLAGGGVKYPEVLIPGSSILAQLVLWVEPKSFESLAPVARSREANLIGCNSKEFISQPLEKSPLTHVMGRVIKTDMQEYPPNSNRYPKGCTRVEILLSVGKEVKMVVSDAIEGRVALQLPSKGDILHLCGVMECQPSFSLHKLFSPVRGQITRTWECRNQSPEEWKVWGIVEIELTSSTRTKPTFQVDNLSK